MDLRPEAEVLLCCARTRLDSGAADRLRALLELPLDWDYLLRIALVNAMMPLLDRHLSHIAPSAMPPASREVLVDHVRANAARNFILTRELKAILALLEHHGVPAIPFKGPVLAEALYGDLSLREFVDLDILIRQEDMATVGALLGGRGYRSVMSRLTPAQDRLYRAVEAEYDFIRADGVLIEPHWAITPRFFTFALEPRDLWQRARQVPFRGSVVTTFSPEDLMLVLCGHGAKDLWRSLRWITDVAQLIDTHPALDWATIMDRARSLGAERMVLLGVLLARQIRDDGVPEDIAARIRRDRALGPLATRIVRRLFQEVTGPPEAPERVWMHLRMRERMRDRWRYVIRFLTTPGVSHVVALPLPARLVFLYNLVIPVWRLARQARRLVERATAKGA